MKARKIIYIVAIVVLLAIFAVSAVYVIDYFVDSAQQKAQYDELAGIVESIQKDNPVQTMPTGASEPGETEGTEPAQSDGSILPEYAPLYQMNDDLVGWLRIDGTNVNYPVMQTPDSVDYYLYRNFNKEYNIRGCLYARETCDITTPSDNITIYGHNMKDGSMFHDLADYQSEEFYQKHSTITFDTITERHTYQIFAVFKTSASVGKGFSYHRFENADNQKEFDDFIDKCKELSFYDTGITPEYGDKIICLSTCEYTLENGRFVVVAYRVS